MRRIWDYKSGQCNNIIKIEKDDRSFGLIAGLPDGRIAINKYNKVHVMSFDVATVPLKEEQAQTQIIMKRPT